ncbi:MAG TPA: alkaline phosphatase D family protein [Nocardioides sp.]|nr:alkaline phosphatase D family protein [Nocardioides sp.]
MGEGDGPLVLGPMLRYVDETSAGIWVETQDAGRVTVRAGGRSWSHATFAVHGHHYALVELDGLEPGSRSTYQVEIGGQRVWPPEDAAFPEPFVATLEPGRRLRMAWGSCRTSVPHDEAGTRTHGVDALRAFALRLAEDDRPWPDLMLHLGDQVYADETSDEMREFIAARRDIDEPPGDELRDYEEYAHLYKLAWSDPTVRWLLSTLPNAMIFDDHDIRDDWNTSHSWKQKMDATEWWHRRLVSGLSSYWVYQHVGNLSHEERAEDELWTRIAAHDADDDELDVTADLEALVERADADPETYRWSYTRDIAEVRLVVVDTRAARVLEPSRRAMLDDAEMAWLEEHLTGGFRHLLVGTSLPFLLPAGLQAVEAWNEAVAQGAWGRWASRAAERVRQAIDLEHWGAFQRSFRAVADLVVAVADGERGPRPRSVTFLSGDVHHSYVSEVRRRRGARIVQAVCSPIRNPLPRAIRFVTAIFAYPVAGFLGTLVARSAKVPNPPFRWRKREGPWFDNCIAMLEDREDGLALTWETGVVGDDVSRPGLERVGEALVRPR